MVCLWNDDWRPRFAQAVHLPKSKVYCLCTYGAWVYAFGANTHTMYILSIKK